MYAALTLASVNVKLLRLNYFDTKEDYGVILRTYSHTFDKRSFSGPPPAKLGFVAGIAVDSVCVCVCVCVCVLQCVQAVEKLCPQGAEDPAATDLRVSQRTI